MNERVGGREGRVEIKNSLSYGDEIKYKGEGFFSGKINSERRGSDLASVFLEFQQFDLI